MWKVLDYSKRQPVRDGEIEDGLNKTTSLESLIHVVDDTDEDDYFIGYSVSDYCQESKQLVT